jgi:transposase
MNLKRTDEKSLKAVQLHTDGITMEEIGKQLGVCRRTILRWLADPALQAEISSRKRIRDEQFARTVHRKFRAIRAQMVREHKERMAKRRHSFLYYF